MIGGARASFESHVAIWRTLAPGAGDIPRTRGLEGAPKVSEQGYVHAGQSGSGHFVKMIHNGIEYGMMQALAEGFDILKHAASPKLPEEHRLPLDVAEIAEVWRRGSVI